MVSNLTFKNLSIAHGSPCSDATTALSMTSVSGSTCHILFIFQTVLQGHSMFMKLYFVFFDSSLYHQDKTDSCSLLLFFWIFETGSRNVALAVLEFTMEIRLASSSQRVSFLCLPSAGINGMCHYVCLDSCLEGI